MTGTFGFGKTKREETPAESGTATLSDGCQGVFTVATQMAGWDEDRASRTRALELALENATGESVSEVIDAAERYCKFIKGETAAPPPEKQAMPAQPPSPKARLTAAFEKAVAEVVNDLGLSGAWVKGNVSAVFPDGSGDGGTFGVSYSPKAGMQSLSPTWKDG